LSFKDAEDKTLKQNLKKPSVLAGVLAWMVEGAKRWYSLSSRGLPMPAEVQELVNEQRYTLDTVQQFLDQECRVGDGMYTSGAELHTQYTIWAEGQGYTPYKRPTFSATMIEKGYPVVVKKVAGKATRVHDGIGLGAEPEPILV
jgi:phage/plasmid-associated DNA primase